MTCQHPTHRVVTLPGGGIFVPRHITEALENLGADYAVRDLLRLENRGSGFEWCSACGAWRRAEREQGRETKVGPWTTPEPRP